MMTFLESLSPGSQTLLLLCILVMISSIAVLLLITAFSRRATHNLSTLLTVVARCFPNRTDQRKQPQHRISRKKQVYRGQ